MKIPLYAALFAATLATPALAFTNLDFESATPPPGDPSSIVGLSWDVAAPGWSHSTGDDTDFVYYGAPPLGLSQYYLLSAVDSWPSLLLAGNYSLSFSNGVIDREDPASAFAQAYIAQTGSIDSTAQFIELLAIGSLQVSIDGNTIAMTAIGGNRYRGDISAWAGQTVELRITNGSSLQSDALTVDDIRLVPVPVPATLGLYAGALATLAAWRRRSHS